MKALNGVKTEKFNWNNLGTQGVLALPLSFSHVFWSKEPKSVCDSPLTICLAQVL